MSETNIKVSVELVDKATQKALSGIISGSDQADKGLNKLKKSSEGAFSEIAVHIGKATGIYDIFVGNLAANLATKAFDVLIAGATKLFQTFVVDGVKAAKEQQVATQSLNLALAQTGIYSKETAADIQKFAEKLQLTTGVADDVIIKNAALIQNLAQLDKDGLKRTTAAAIDLSAALAGKDVSVETASEALAKAANGNITALQRMGIAIQKGHTNAETFANALRAVEERFGGSAAKKLNDYSGAVQFATGQFGELQEEIGNGIVKNNAVIEVWKEAGKIINELTGSVQGQSQAWKELVAQGLILAIKGTNLLVLSLDTLVRLGTMAFDTLRASVYGFASAIYGVLSLVSSKFDAPFKRMTQAADEAVKSVGRSLTEDTKLSEVSQMLFRLEEAANQGFNALKDGASTAVEPLNQVVKKKKELSDEQKKLNEELHNWVRNLAKTNTEGQSLLDSRLEMLRLQRERELISEEEFFTQKGDAEQAYWDMQVERAESFKAKTLIQEQEKADALAALDDKRTKAQIKNELELTKFKEQQEKQRQADTKSSLSYIATLQSSNSMELFRVGQAAAIANATINMYEGISKAWALGPILGPILAPLVAVAGAAQIAGIASQQPKFEQGGIVPGNSFSGDQVQARVNSGEMILNRSQQAELFRVANGGGGFGGEIRELVQLTRALLSKDERIVVNIGGRSVVDTLRSELLAGRSFA